MTLIAFAVVLTTVALPYWSCQLAFDAAQFEALIPWLEKRRAGLSILVHGLTGNDLEDHTANASWLGEPAKLNLSVFGP